MFKKIKNIHFVGIGGSGMSGIAEVLLTLGYSVSGSDAKESDVTRRLAGMGAKIFLGHRADHVGGAHVVVTSTAVQPDNPEVIEAHGQKIPVIPRIEMLAELARLKYTIAVGGTHGKTTTTSLISLVLQAGGLDPTVIVGGRMHNLGTGARVGRGEYLVAEADESDGSFLKLAPTLAVVTNIDDDHLDYWGTLSNLVSGFERFANKVPFYGRVILGVDDLGSRKIGDKIRRPLLTYGISPDADIQARDICPGPEGTTFSVYRFGTLLGDIHWNVPGRHNVINSLAAVAAGLELDVPFLKIAEALASFQGVGRRLEWKGERGGVAVMDDYGHHPTEIKATLQALKERFPQRRAVVVFQPHRYSRTRNLADEFAASFSQADVVGLLDIYAASEAPLPGVTSDWLAERVRAQGVSVTRLTAETGPATLRGLVKKGDVVLTLGAGDVWRWGEQLLAALAPASAP
ncbi:MAG: UDP-N-acetylmuramate--L-alanine ligase [Elusimicrobia bacterium]|nr:UDP-N-acetylmuramate--L-alanine ligase [Elusimicrobiota bacterium]